MPDCTVTIVGNATADPELRFTQNGSATARFGVAGAVPGSRRLHVIPRRTTLNPSLAMSDASDALKFHDLPGAGYSSYGGNL